MKWWWTKEVADSTFHVGLTREALSELGVVWQYIPRVGKTERVLKNGALATIHTTTRLQSLVSPLTGKVLHVTSDVIDRPDRITPATMLFVIESKDALPSV